MAEPAIDMWGRGDYRKIATDHQIMCERLCEALCITSAHRVLDVACGTGNAAIAAARRRAKVVGVDFSPTLLEKARKRVEVEGTAEVEFIEADIRTLPFADASFDVVISTLGATFMPDQAAMARELLRVVRPGGRVALTAYARQSLPSDIYNISAELAPPPPGSGPPAYIWTDGRRAAELLGDGTVSVEVSHHSYDACFASADAFFDHNITYYGPMITRFAAMSPEHQTVYRQRVTAAMENYNRATDGSLVVRFDYAAIVATRANS